MAINLISSKRVPWFTRNCGGLSSPSLRRALPWCQVCFGGCHQLPACCVQIFHSRTRGTVVARTLVQCSAWWCRCWCYRLLGCTSNFECFGVILWNSKFEMWRRGRLWRQGTLWFLFLPDQRWRRVWMVVGWGGRSWPLHGQSHVRNHCVCK